MKGDFWVDDSKHPEIEGAVWYKSSKEFLRDFAAGKIEPRRVWVDYNYTCSGVVLMTLLKVAGVLEVYPIEIEKEGG